MAEHDSEELDIAKIMEKVKQGYHSFLIGAYNIFYFFVSRWIILLVLIVLGLVAGYFLQNDKYSKETTLLVQVNFDGVNYVYDAVEQLENKIQERDTISLKEIGFDSGNKLVIKKIEIEPVVDVLEIVRSDKGDERNVEVLLDQSKLEDDLLTSDIFIPKYKLHKISLYFASYADQNTISNFLDYLNNNPIMNEIKDITQESVRKEIIQNEQSISYIDSIVKAYGIVPKMNAGASQIYFNNMDINNGNVHLLFEQKNLIIEKNKNLRIELLKYDNIVQLLNKPMLQVKKGFFDNKIIALPILFVLVFILFSILKYFYLKAKRLSLLNNKL